MPLDGQVLAIAIFAVALKLYLWFSEKDVVRGDIEPDRNDRLRLDNSGLRLLAEARSEGTEGVAATSLHPRLEGDRYV
jgi:ubiquinone biosynthesis protein UbiJ